MNRMRIEDLSIGDWVQARMTKWDYDDLDITPAMRVIQIGYSEAKLELNGVEHYAFVEDLQPIPITAEVLEQNGISKTYESDEYTVYKGEGFNITEYYTELWEFEIHRNRLMIRNVHQLQHALRLVGVGKEIEL